MAAVFIPVVGHIGLIFHNQKVETCIQSNFKRFGVCLVC